MGCHNTKAPLPPTTGCDGLPPSPTQSSPPNSNKSEAQPVLVASREIRITTPPPSPKNKPPPSPTITPEILSKRKETNEQAPFTASYSKQVEISLHPTKIMKVELFCNLSIPLEPPPMYKSSLHRHNNKICKNCGQKKTTHITGKVYEVPSVRAVRAYRCEYCKQIPPDLTYDPEVTNIPATYKQKIICTKCYIKILRENK